MASSLGDRFESSLIWALSLPLRCRDAGRDGDAPGAVWQLSGLREPGQPDEYNDNTETENPLPSLFHDTIPSVNVVVHLFSLLFRFFKIFDRKYAVYCKQEKYENHAQTQIIFNYQHPDADKCSHRNKHWKDEKFEISKAPHLISPLMIPYRLAAPTLALQRLHRRDGQRDKDATLIGRPPHPFPARS